MILAFESLRRRICKAAGGDNPAMMTIGDACPKTTYHTTYMPYTMIQYMQHTPKGKEGRLGKKGDWIAVGSWQKKCSDFSEETMI